MTKAQVQNETMITLFIYKPGSHEQPCERCDEEMGCGWHEMRSFTRVIQWQLEYRDRLEQHPGRPLKDHTLRFVEGQTVVDIRRPDEAYALGYEYELRVSLDKATSCVEELTTSVWDEILSKMNKYLGSTLLSTPSLKRWAQVRA